jgi:hypothetical protein
VQTGGGRILLLHLKVGKPMETNERITALVILLREMREVRRTARTDQLIKLTDQVTTDAVKKLSELQKIL